MTWQNILKLGKPKRWYKFVDEVMSDKQSRTTRQIVELIVETPGTRGTRRQISIPSAVQISQYLRSNSKYQKVKKNEWVIK